MDAVTYPHHVDQDPQQQFCESSEYVRRAARTKWQPGVDEEGALPPITQERPLSLPDRADAKRLPHVNLSHVRPLPRMSIASSNREYVTENSCLSIPSLTASPRGEDRSRISRYEPSGLPTAPMGEQ